MQYFTDGSQPCPLVVIQMLECRQSREARGITPAGLCQPVVRQPCERAAFRGIEYLHTRSGQQ
jgi:hypothetical protein